MPADPILTVFGHRIAARRNALDLSQEELAHRAGLTGKYISQIERGAANPSLLVLHKLAHGFGTTPAVLLDAESDVARQVVAELSPRTKKDQLLVLHVVKALLAKL